jgi:predicted naringenin-chalcone synthase
MDPIEVFLQNVIWRKKWYLQSSYWFRRKVLDKALIEKPEDLDYIITVSCTGIMIPSLDAYLINKLKLRQDIVRLL